MEKNWKKEIGQYTARILVRYYDNDIEPFLNSCHKNVLWLGPAEGQMIRTRDKLVETFSKEMHDLKFAVNDLEVISIPTGSSQTAEVLLRFMVDTFWPDGSWNRVHQRISFTWGMEGSEPKILSCHISNAIAYDKRDVIYPVHYEESFKKMELEGEARSVPLCFKGPDKALLYVNIDRILYAETQGTHTLIHTPDKVLECRERLPEIEKKCEGALLRIHQSYLVNPEHVSRIWRFEVEIDNGMTLPVPEKKYTEIKGKLGTV